MPGADTNRIALLYVAETTFGTTPNTPAMKFLRYTGESFKQDTESVVSQEIRSDRQIPDVIRTNIGASGSLNFEFSASAFDDFLVAILQSAGWSSAVTVGPIATISVDDTDNSFNDSGSGFGSFVVGQWIKTSGFSTAANNGWFKIVTKTNAKITVSGGTLVTESAAAGRTIIMGAQIVNGTTFQSFTIEKQFTDLANTHAVYTGMALNGMSMNTARGAILNGAFDFLGVRETSQTATRATALSGSQVAAPTEEVMNAVDDVVTILENQTAFDTLSLTFQITNNLRARTKIAFLGAESMGSGQFSVTGSFECNFSSATQFNKYLNFNATSFAWVLRKGTKSYVFEFPRVKLTQGQRSAGSANADVTTPFNFQAMLDPTSTITMRIARW